MMKIKRAIIINDEEGQKGVFGEGLHVKFLHSSNYMHFMNFRYSKYI